MLVLLVVFIGTILFMTYNADTDFCHPKHFILKLLFILILSLQLFKILPMLSILVCYALISSCYLSSWHHLDHFCSRQKQKNFIFLHGCSITFIDLLVLVFLFLYFPLWREVLEIIPFISLAGCILIFIPRNVNCKRMGNTSIRFYGLCGNSSVTASLMSLLAIGSLASNIPYIGVAGWIFGVIGTIKSFGSAGFGGLVLGSTVYWMFILPKVVVLFYISILVTTPLWWKWSNNHFGGNRHKIFGITLHSIFSMSGREHLWVFAWKKLYVTYAKAHWKFKWFGVGNGSFQYAMPALQVRDKDPMFTENKQLLTWLHSDYIQWAIEGGILGVILLVFATAEIFYIAHLDPVSMGVLLCMVVNCAANFSFRMAPDTFILILFLKRLVN